MSDADRAAKAARARAMLKKRQQQKVGGGGTSESPVASPDSPPHSRPFTPNILEVQTPLHSGYPPPDKNGHGPNNSRDLGDLFAKEPAVKTPAAAANDSWLSSLERVETPPPRTPPVYSPPPIVAPRPRPPELRVGSLSASRRESMDKDDSRALVQDQARKIAALEAEKASLSSSLEKLKHTESKLQHTHDLLQSERVKSQQLQGNLQRIQSDIAQLSGQTKGQEAIIASLEADKASLAASVGVLQASEAELERSRVVIQNEQQRSQDLQSLVDRTQADVDSLSAQVHSQQEKIRALEAEQATLNMTVTRLHSADARAQELDKVLLNERAISQAHQIRINGLESNLHDLTSHSEQQQQTISLLVSEKTTLTASLDRLQDAESSLRETSVQLGQERGRAEHLQRTVHQLEAEGRESTERVAQLSAKEKELADKTREQEREIQLLTGSFEDLRIQADEAQRRVRELEEQIESDDRAERLEATLQHTQDHAADLELQVSKLKQAQSLFKTEREELESQINSLKESETSWQAQHAEVRDLHETTGKQLSSVTKERDSLAQERDALRKQIGDHQTSLTELQQKFSQTMSELALSVRALQQAQAELKAANRRAEEAERVQKDLQAEGIGLMRSLDEMRPKIVELTDVKLELIEKAESLQDTIKSRDSMITNLETSLEELREQKENAEKQLEQTKTAFEKERTSSYDNASELQKAYTDSQAELQAARLSVQNLEGERTEYREMATRHLEEVERLSATLQSQTDQSASLRADLEEHNRARDEAQQSFERIQADIETLRGELAAKDEELDRLQTPGLHSLSNEMPIDIQQQHEIELSEAQSKIRSLETTVFEAEAKMHTLQKQVSTLEDQLTHFRSSSRTSQRPGMGTVPPRPLSRGVVDHSDELRRQSFGTHCPSNLSVQPVSDFDGLSPETRHKRRVSLGMLKARIDSETKASTSRNSSPVVKHSPLPTVVEPAYSPSPLSSLSPRHSQFLDESHVFWCHSCQGDLVVL